MEDQRDSAPVGEGRPRLDWSELIVPIAVSVLTGLPAFLVGTLAVDLRADLGFSSVALGALVAVYSGVAAVIAFPAARFVDRIGYARGLTLSPLLAGLAMGAPALLARSWWHLAAGQFVAALAVAVAVPAVQVAVATRIPPERQGIAFGINLAAVPVAILLAGIAVPLIGETVGWRWAVGGAGAISLATAGGAVVAFQRPGRTSVHTSGAPVQMSLALLSAGAMFLAVWGAQSVATFAVESGVESGHTAGSVGYAVALASIVSIVMRIAGGHRADRTGPARAFGFIIVTITLGGAGISMLAVGGGFAVVALGVVVGLGFGWGWNGVLSYGLIRVNPRAAAGTTAFIMLGGFGGSAVGPIATGALVSASGYPAAWAVSAAAMFGAAVLMVVARRDPRLAVGS